MPTLAVTIDQTTIDQISARTQGDGRRSDTLGKSQVVERDLDRYYTLLRYARADLRSLLSGNEIAAIVDNLNGVWLADSPEIGIRGIPLNVADGVQMSGLAQKWAIEGITLIEKLRDLSFVHLSALADAAERFWIAPEGKHPGDALND